MSLTTFSKLSYIIFTTCVYFVTMACCTSQHSNWTQYIIFLWGN